HGKPGAVEVGHVGEVDDEGVDLVRHPRTDVSAERLGVGHVALPEETGDGVPVRLIKCQRAAGDCRASSAARTLRSMTVVPSSLVWVSAWSISTSIRPDPRPWFSPR